MFQLHACTHASTTLHPMQVQPARSRLGCLLQPLQRTLDDIFPSLLCRPSPPSSVISSDASSVAPSSAQRLLERAFFCSCWSFAAPFVVAMLRQRCSCNGRATHAPIFCCPLHGCYATPQMQLLRQPGRVLMDHSLSSSLTSLCTASSLASSCTASSLASSASAPASTGSGSSMAASLSPLPLTTSGALS